MTAVCSACGPVPLRSRGKGRFACGKKLAAKHARWVKENPQRARQNRKSRSAHRLTSFDASTHTGQCPVCGTVGVVPKGRGYMCRTRAEELWTIQQDAPQQRCPDCLKNYLSADGSCRYCSDREGLDWAYALRMQQHKGDEMQRVHDTLEPSLGFVIDPQKYDTRSVAGDQVANPALKTIGGGVTPPGMRPQRFIDKWWADNGHLVEEAL